MTLLTLIITLFILGLIAWLVSISPITNPTFKSFINFALIVVGAIVLIAFVIGVFGGNVGKFGNLKLY